MGNLIHSIVWRRERKCKTPSTECDNVLVPKVSDEIWSKLPANAQTLGLQHYKKKVSSAITYTTDKLLEHIEKETNPLISPLLDTVALLGHVCTELPHKKTLLASAFLPLMCQKGNSFFE